MQPIKSEWPAGGLPVRIENGFLVCREDDQDSILLQFPVPLYHIECIETLDFYGKLAITIKPKYSANGCGNKRFVWFGSPLTKLYHEHDTEIISANDWTAETLAAEKQFVADCDKLIADFALKQKAEAPEFFVDKCTKMIPPIWIDDDLNIIKRGKMVGNMDDAGVAWTGRRHSLHIVMYNGRRINAKSPMSVYLAKQDAGEPADLPARIEHSSFYFISETAREIVSCHLRSQRLEVVRRRNDEWRSDREFEAEQFKLITKKDEIA
jgi:hypothetical protein